VTPENDGREASASTNPVARAILRSLDAALTPRHVEVVNESDQHSVPRGSESHFRVVVVSEAFDGKRLVARHRLVNKALAEQLSGPVHALAIQAFTPNEWTATIEHQPAQSPECLGGSKHDRA
jgi:BolA protein